MGLAGKVALVTGSTSGIGLGIARALAAEGADIAMNGFGDPAAIEALRAGIAREFAVRAAYFAADMGQPAQIGAMVRAAQAALGGVDILVNNAARGLERPRPAIEQRPMHLHATMDVNLFGPWTAIQQAVPLMERRGGGAVVNLLSPGAWQYMPGYSAVGVSKAALESLTRYLAVELAPRAIRVNGVSAGWVEGSDGAQAFGGAISERARAFVPAGRNVQPEDVASAVVWLCSDEAAMLIGQTIYLDGGFGLATWRSLMERES